MRLIYDIMPPQKKAPISRCYAKQTLMKIICLLLVIGLNWLGISAIIKTVAYLSDIETSSENLFAAGSLDFILNSPLDFMPQAIAPGESTSRDINFINNNNYPKYKVRTDEFTGLLCNYLTLEASVDGGTSVSMSLIGFISDVVYFTDPDEWSFKLTLPADAPQEIQGQTCQFKFIFDGSQIKNDLDFGLGFNDTEDILNNVIAKICRNSETRTMGYWKNHSSVYNPHHLPQTLGAPGGDSIIGNEAQVTQIFEDYDLSMRDKLMGQLLAMKFNIDHFGIGEYFVEFFEENPINKTLNQIVVEADELLRDAATPNDILEDMKNLLDYLNNLHEIIICSDEPILGIVINEFLPNPAGSDNASMPDGEWVELYNKTGADINVADWWLYDSADCHDLAITNSNTNTGDTVVPANGFLAVYRNGDNNFALNNTGGDSVRLYAGKISDGASLIDSHVYTIDAPEGKSFARIPDGSDTWVDPIPTPGESNVLEGEDVVFGPAVSEPDELDETTIENDGAEAENTTIFEEALNEIKNLIDNLVGENQQEQGTSTSLETEQEEQTVTEEPAIVEGESLIEEVDIINEPIIEIPIETPIEEGSFTIEEPVIEETNEEPIIIEGESLIEEVDIINEPIIEIPIETPIEETNIVIEEPPVEESPVEESPQPLEENTGQEIILPEETINE